MPHSCMFQVTEQTELRMRTLNVLLLAALGKISCYLLYVNLCLYLRLTIYHGCHLYLFSFLFVNS